MASKPVKKYKSPLNTDKVFSTSADTPSLHEINEFDKEFHKFNIADETMRLFLLSSQNSDDIKILDKVIVEIDKRLKVVESNTILLASILQKRVPWYTKLFWKLQNRLHKPKQNVTEEVKNTTESS